MPVQGAATAASPQRVEAHSSDLLAVGVVQGARMNIHVSQIQDNAPVRDAVVSVLLRGSVHPTLAAADGSYAFESKDLTLPGSAEVEFQLSGPVHENLKGTLDINVAGAAGEASNSSRQLWWWVLNFAVCIGFLWLFSRRKKAAEKRAAET